MNTYKLLLHDKLIVFLMMGVCALLIFSGCQQPVPKEEVIRPVFFPKAPDKPRLQFLKSFSGPEDVGVKSPSALERFIVGEPETTEAIVKPYGLAIIQGKLYV